MMENNIWNETILWQNETRRMRRHANYPALEAGEPRLVRKLADQMRALPLEKVRQIRSVAEELKVGEMDKDEKCVPQFELCDISDQKAMSWDRRWRLCVKDTVVGDVLFSSRGLFHCDNDHLLHCWWNWNRSLCLQKTIK